MAKRHQKHWGDWLKQRAEVLGFKRHADVARRIGCSRQQLTNWFAMSEPPSKMRKGFDSRLAGAMGTTKRTLFIDYENVSPDATPRLMLIPDHAYSPDARAVAAFFRTQTLFTEVMARLLPSELDKALDYIITLVLSEGDFRAGDFQRYKRQLYGDEKLPEEHPLVQVRQKDSARERVEDVKPSRK